MYEKIWNQNKIAFGGDYNPEQWDEATWGGKICTCSGWRTLIR